MTEPSKYWICDECAEEKGWGFPLGNVTIAERSCEYCNGEKQIGKFVTPVVDFDRPGKKAIWD